MSTSNTDVLVIGSGPVGATFARLLAGAGRRVTMIDAGPQLSLRPGTHLANAFMYQQQPNLFLSIILAQLEAFSVPPNKRQPLPPDAYVPPADGRVNFENLTQNPELNMPLASASYGVGGMGTHWTCCAPDPASMERTPLIPESEWPVLVAIARKLLNVHTDAFSPSFTNEIVKGMLNARGFAFTNLPMAAEKRAAHSPLAHLVTWTGTDTVLGPLLDGTDEERERLQLWSEHRARKLIVNGQKVDGAEVLDLRNFTTKTIFADTVVVAAGPFLTPSVLWQSDIRPYALGRFLNANHTVSSTVVLTNEVINLLRADPKNPAAKDRVVPIAWNDPPVMLGTQPTAEKPWHTQVQRTGQYLSYDLAMMGINEPFTDARIVVDLIWYGMVEPQAGNRIVFDPERTDRFGQPQITIEYRVGAQDMVVGAAMMEDMVKAAETIGRFIPTTGEPMVQTPGSTLHYQGTCRMGDDNGVASVVDTESRVWGFDNLYLGSVGVIPTKMASNPTLTACALAARAVAGIAGCSIHDLAVQIGVAETA